ncbi:RING-H2 finger protein ATL57-like [Miscanthus floridulus]|uniref:RING-H2 finger protein ATL57-like n=1 Tax=Miscanthus floridulus TaxID=154761 RepID=UPI003458857D
MLYVIGARWGLSILVFVSVLLCAGASRCKCSSRRHRRWSQDRRMPSRKHNRVFVHCNGLGASAIAALPAYVYHKKAGRDECAVCLGELQRGEVVKQLPACMHLFHEGCIDAWLRSRITCPVCRSPVNTALPVAAQIMVRAE